MDTTIPLHGFVACVLLLGLGDTAHAGVITVTVPKFGEFADGR